MLNNCLISWRTIYEGCFLLRELSPKTLAKVSSFGELLSSYIIAKAANEEFTTVYKDSRELIVASDNYNNAIVDFPATFKKCDEYFSTHSQKVTIIPGFVARTSSWKNNYTWQRWVRFYSINHSLLH
jgi:aspartokinase/homoserine dehydrogenase 1